MKITHFETFLANAGLRNYLFIRLRTDTGLTGVGEASLEWQEKTVQTLLHEWVEGRVLGRDPFDVEAVIGGLVRDHLLAEPVDLAAEPRVLGLRVDEPGEPAVRIPERPRDALGADLERPQHRGAAALDAVQAAARRLAEVDRDQHDRDEDEHPCHDAPPESGGAAGGVPGRPGARYGGPQDRKSCVAVPWHETT